MKRGISIALKVLFGVGILGSAPIAGIALAARTEASRVHNEPIPVVNQPKATAEASATPNDFPAVLLPPQMANLSPLVDARIFENKVKVGQRVTAGQVLVSLDLREMQHDLLIAEAQLKQAKADAAASCSDAAAARLRAKRRNATVDIGGGKRAGVVSGEELDQARADAASAGAKCSSGVGHIAEMKARVSQLKLQLEQSEIRAPYDGLVTGIYFEPGMTAHNTDVVARVVGGGQGLRARIAVSDDAAPLLKRKNVKLTFDDKSLKAVIDQVAPEVEPASRTFVIEGNVDLDPKACGGDCALLAGRVVRASLLP